MAGIRSSSDVGNRLDLLRRDLMELDQLGEELAVVAEQYESADLRAHLQRIERLKLRLRTEMRRLMH
jgi:hypothetical protein